MALPLETWVRFFVWLIIGFEVYFPYGRVHSLLNAEPVTPDSSFAGYALLAAGLFSLFAGGDLSFNGSALQFRVLSFSGTGLQVHVLILTLALGSAALGFARAAPTARRVMRLVALIGTLAISLSGALTYGTLVGDTLALAFYEIALPFM